MMSSNALRRTVWVIVLLSLVWAAVFALNWIPILRGGAGWRWPYVLPEHPGRLLLFAAVVCMYLAGAWWLLKHCRSIILILWAMVGSISLTIAMLYISVPRPHYELFTRTVSAMTTGWHYSSLEVDEWGGALGVLRQWPDFMSGCVGVCVHVATSPPGMSLIYYGANQLLEQMPAIANSLAEPLRSFQCHDYFLMSYANASLASAWLGILMPLWGGLTVWPLYWLGIRLNCKRTALWGVLLWPLVPAYLMFMPHPSTVYPLFSITIVALLIEGVHRDSISWVIVSGAMASVSILISFVFIPLSLLVGILLLTKFYIEADRSRFTWQWFLRIGAGYGVGFFAVWIAYYFLSGFTPWELIASDAMREGHLLIERPYFIWIFLHLNDFFMFTGWPLILLAGLGIWQSWQTLWKKSALSMWKAMSLSVFITLLAVDVSGFVRGESGRVWLFFAPFFVLIAVNTFEHDGASHLLWAIIGTQGIITVVMVGVLHVMDSGLTDPPDSPPPLVELPENSYIPSGSLFGDVFRLESFAGQIEMLPDMDGVSQPTLELWLNWRSEGRVDSPYYISAIPVDPNGQPTQATLVQPFGGAYPTTCWMPESGLIQERIEAPVASDDAEGEWWVSLSLIDGDTGDKLPVAMPDGTIDDQVGIGPFRSLLP